MSTKNSKVLNFDTSFRLYKAFQFANGAHRGQKRKLGEDPVIVHPVSVALLLGDYFQDPDLMIAGLLHDVVEDTLYTLEDIRKQFGDRIMELVDGVSEQDKSLPWAERKKRYFARLQTSSMEVIRISAADKFHNFSDLFTQWKAHGDAIFTKFNASKDAILAQYEKLFAFYTEKHIPWMAPLTQMLNEIMANSILID